MRPHCLSAGLDAHMVRQWTDFSASGVLFDREGKRILIGSAGDRARLVELGGEAMQTSPLTNSGPVAFGEDGAPLQLLFDAPNRSLRVVDVLTGQTTREWAGPAPIGADRVASNSLVDARPQLAFTPDGSCAAGAFAGSDGRQYVAAFLPGAVRSLMGLGVSVSAVAISADGSLVAAGESTGRVHVWSTRDASRIAEFSAGRVEILSLALRQIARHRDSPEASTSGTWLLAVGDAGGTVAIWDVESETAIAHCVGGHHHIYAVAFSPNGATLASGGRGPVKLWDVGTGRLLLECQWGDYITDLDFSPDGACLAVSAQNKNPPYEGGLAVWRLEFGRGIQTLRGLSGQVSKVCLSPDGRRCAALSHRWEVGVWDMAEGRLLRIFEAPVGRIADNASLAWSPDGQRLAFASWQAARLWDISSGQTLRRWDERQLPPGLCDTLAFPDQEHLFLFRVETRDGKRPPLRAVADPKDHPCVCRLRELLNSDHPTLIAEITDFSGHVREVEAPPDGRWFVVEGMSALSDEKSAIMKCFDGRTGRELWSRDLWREECGLLVIDAAGELLCFPQDPRHKALLVELQTGREIEVLDFWPWAIRAEPRLYAGNAFGRSRAICLFDAPGQAPLMTLAVDPSAASHVRFNAEGNRLAWGNADGTVTVCHLEEIENRLRAAGMSWQP